MTDETPEGFERKKGLFAITYQSKIIYIGKAGWGNTVYRESKRIGKCAKLLQEHGVLPASMSYEDRWNFASVHCGRYVGVVTEEIPDGRLNWLLRNGENLLIYKVNKKTELYNEYLKKRYLYDRPFSVRNYGDKPSGMETQYNVE